jgi:hypothetical protein
MNTIYFNKKYELRKDYYVIPFSCSDLNLVNTEVLHRDRSEAEQKVLEKIMDRISLALLENGFEMESVNFSSMSISARKIETYILKYSSQVM